MVTVEMNDQAALEEMAKDETRRVENARWGLQKLKAARTTELPAFSLQ